MGAAVNRLVIAIGLAGAFAAPGLAQPTRQQVELDLRESQLRARESMIDRQIVAQQNQLSALDAQARAQQAIDDVRAQGYSPTVPPPPPGVTPTIDPSQMASIPDDKLAASNERVRAAARNHR